MWQCHNVNDQFAIKYHLSIGDCLLGYTQHEICENLKTFEVALSVQKVIAYTRFGKGGVLVKTHANLMK